MPEHEMRNVVDAVTPDGPAEVDGPNRHTGTRRLMSDDERRMCKVEFKIERIALICAHNERRFKCHRYGNGQTSRRTLRALDLYLVRSDHRASSRRKSYRGVC